MPDQPSPTVAHLVGTYLYPTGSWIYHQVISSRRFRAVALSAGARNLETFPFDRLHAFDLQPLHSRAWLRLRGGSHEGARQRFWLAACRKEQVSLVHAHFGQTGVRALPIAAKRDAPLITSFYGADMSMSEHRQLYGELFDRGSVFLVEGPAAKATLVALGCNSAKICIHHIGIDLTKIALAETRHIPGEATFVAAAWIREKKGIDDALKAFSHVHARFPRTRFRIFGGGPLLSAMEALSRELGTGSAVEFTGPLEYPTYLRELSTGHIFLAPSVTARDGDTEGGAPVSLIEAQAAGLPAVATRHADIPEVVTDKETGFLVAERDVDALASQMTALVTNPDLAAAMGARARVHVEREFNLVTQAARLDEIYGEALSSRKQ